MTLDKMRMKQIIQKYLSNATKYTGAGFIKIKCQYSSGWLQVVVEDTGIGISEDKHDKVFGRFNKFDNYAQGTGLGLSIVRALAELMGGNVWFESTEKVGSKSYVRVPCIADITYKEPSLSDKN